MSLLRLIAGTALVGLAAAAVFVMRERPARSADHLDSPAAKMDPTVDLADHYAWMDGTNLVLTMTLYPNAPHGALFSDKAQYVFHTSSQAQYGSSFAFPYDIICTFAAPTDAGSAPQTITCWGGTDVYVKGDPSQTGGLANSDGRFKVFAGLRADPFFFNLDGFHAVEATVESAAPGLSFDPFGCPVLDAGTAGLLQQELQTTDGGAPVDFFANFNALAIVVSVDKSLVTGSGPIVSSWVATYRTN